jgi:hypothetical protein
VVQSTGGNITCSALAARQANCSQEEGKAKRAPAEIRSQSSLEFTIQG